MHGEAFVGATEDGDEVVFKGSDGAFGGVAAVDVGRHQLVRDIVFAFEESFDGGGGFIVHSVDLGGAASLVEIVQ